jgi:hypothetical protein
MATSPRRPATRSGAASSVGCSRGRSRRRAALVAGRERRRSTGAGPRARAGGAAACRRGDGARRSGGRTRGRSVGSAALCALDLDEREADVGQRVAQGGAVGAEPLAEALDEAADGIDRQSGLMQARAGLAPRWIAASSYRPITWLATTTSAGTSASRGGPPRARRGHRRAGCRRRRGRRTRIRRSPAFVVSSLTFGTLPATTEAKWGCRLVPTRPPATWFAGGQRCVQVDDTIA